MTAPDDAAFERYVQKLGYLIDLTRVIDRNGEDGAFQRLGGKINYVFDTNVVQMLVEPFRNPQFAEVFFGPMWDNNPIADREINAQNCLIAAEYLFSGDLPGQGRQRQWYMSSGHRDELDVQLDYLNRKIEATTDALSSSPEFKHEALYQLQSLNSALKFEHDDRGYVLELAKRAGIPNDKLRERAVLPATEFQTWAAGIRAREVCRILALDRILEPRWQLDRFHTDPDMLSARRPLEELFGPNGLGVELLREANKWHRTLTSVLARRGTGTRTEAAIRADCETLAALSLTAKNVLSSDQRVVFVTGDRALLEAYKVRYVDEPDSGPFLLRPINHFAPVFNPTSAGSLLHSNEFAFRALREALEGAMLALNLGLFSLDQPSWRLRARDHFSLQADRRVGEFALLLKRFFPGFGRKTWLANQERRLEDLIKQLRPFETLMLEAYPRLVAARLDRRHDDFVRNSERAGKSIDGEIVDQLKSARRLSFKFSLPLMSKVVSELLERISHRNSDWKERAVIPLQLSFSSDPAEYIFYTRQIDKLQGMQSAELDQLLADLARVPSLIFALAAMLAFSLERWKDAVRYAALAAAAANDRGARDRRQSVEEDRYELLYLSAISLRFQLAAWDPRRLPSYGSPLSEWVAKGREELARSEAYHERRGQLSRQVRAISERASLVLSYCEWLAFGPDEVGWQNPDAGPAVGAAFEQVVRDLTRCEELYPLASARGAEEEKLGRPSAAFVLEATTRQFRFNVLAARLVAEQIGRRWPALKSEVDGLVQHLSGAGLTEWKDRPHLAEAYLAAVDNDLNRLRRIDTLDVTLPLDRAIILGLSAMLAERDVSAGS